jgi:hypothetical protein
MLWRERKIYVNQGRGSKGNIQNRVRKDSDCVFRWCRQYLLQPEVLPI